MLHREVAGDGFSSRATVRAPRPGAGMDRPALALDAYEILVTYRGNQTYVEVDVNAMIPRMGGRAL
jgi:hypothetical protein